jgi:hypothetical protein
MNKNRMIVVSMVVMLVLAVMASSASASPAPSGAARPTCASDIGRPYSLGIDGGLTGLSRGEFVAVAPAASFARPLGVDGGVLSLLFAPSQANSFAASTGNACTGV